MKYGIHLLGVFLFFLMACQQHAAGVKNKSGDSLTIRQQYAESAVLDGKAAIAKMVVDPGMEVQLVAAEPLVFVPVAMTFDHLGRMWVVEMTGYMPDTLGTGEEVANGKIVILEDTNKDGVVDSRKVFLDSLVLPRAICLVENGLLVAEPPRLWYVTIEEGDRAGKKTLVDDQYAAGGNVEHQPNGLLRAIDNWIYSAKSDVRYRKAGNKWLKEPTHFRGQWGISQDDMGRLFYNNNSENLIGDYFSPGLGHANTQQRRVSGYDENIVPDNRVYPIRPTPGVNRGYIKGVLDDSLRLVNFTAACGPLVYRGNLLGKTYTGNAFVAEPSANLIKRNILKDSGYLVTGRQAYQGREFLASKDERFRPVSLYNGPDGALYILDMYRGIIQHKTYLTGYLKNEIRDRQLTTPLNCGRIYRIVPKGNSPRILPIPIVPEKLLALLDHPDGAISDMAQQLIVDHHFTILVPSLKERLRHTDHLTGLIHTLWTLEGLGALQAEDLLPLLHLQLPAIRQVALWTIPSIATPENIGRITAELLPMVKDTDVAPSLALLLPVISKLQPATGKQLEELLVHSYAQNRYVADAVINNAQGREQALLISISRWNNDSTLVIRKRLDKILKDIASRRQSKMDEALFKQYPRGSMLFKTICQTCHGADGEGIQSLAPPLNQSQLVTGPKERLIKIILYGLTGPVEVNGKVYKSPEINGDMPGIASNDEFSDADIAQAISFIRSAWSNRAEKVTEKDVQEVRMRYKARQKPFTAAELK